MEKAMTAILLAAGEGKRMQSELPKALHKLCGRSMAQWALRAVADIVQEPPVLVVGHGADALRAAIGAQARYATQATQRGTGHALLCAKEYFQGRAGKLLVMAADLPLLDRKALEPLLQSTAAVSLLTAITENPGGRSRILRAQDGGVAGIVQERDCTEAQRTIREISIPAYCFDIPALCDCIDAHACGNEQAEYDIADCIALLCSKGHAVEAIGITGAQCMAVKNRAQFAACERVLRGRINAAHLEAGVSMMDPDQTYIEDTVLLGRDCMLYPGVVLEGNTEIGAGTTLYPGCRIVDSRIGAGCALQAVVAREAVVGDQVTIGPFVNLRPGTRLSDGCKVGDFVEVKNSNVGKGSKLPHLSYIGDADVGSHVNLGCGTVFVNYDGHKKHRTTVGDNVFIGCNTSLVAPVSVGDAAYTAAGSVITQDVPADCLALGRARQVNKLGYAARLRAAQREKK